MEYHCLFHCLDMGVSVISEKPQEKKLPPIRTAYHVKKFLTIRTTYNWGNDFKVGKQETIYWRPALPHSTGRFQSAGTVYQNAQASLTKEDIKNAFWPKDNNPENKIYSHISTLKSSLKDFPEYQIVTEKEDTDWLSPQTNE